MTKGRSFQMHLDEGVVVVQAPHFHLAAPAIELIARHVVADRKAVDLHATIMQRDVAVVGEAQLVEAADRAESTMLSRARSAKAEGIDHGKARPKAEAVWLILSGESIRDECRELVSPEGIEL